ncbi:PP2C family protein-serine/threonine phosphatase [Solwaraspora sp. WMMB335]|uniref:PP2C family protein-serine/threonine phosphatase n=1 Tax=Solwaraspora sp. WMMB335 TaxID=3404118 RepID=UPI003B942454
MPIRLDAASRTHVGFVRRRNEDSLYQGKWLYAVADGLGGHVAGDIASATAINALRAYDQLVEPEDLAHAMGEAINAASGALRRKIRAEHELSGMGTTVVAMLRAETTAVVGNVGDSRAYLMRDVASPRSTLLRLTEDHIYQHLVAGARTVPDLPEKLTRFLDGRPDGRSPDLTPVHLAPGDRVLLCSDGLSSYVPQQSVQAALNSGGSADSVADQLVSLALEQGGQDNITVIVVDVHLVNGAGR